MADTTLSAIEMDMLRTLVGERVESYEGVTLGPGDFYGALRLNFPNSAVDISNLYDRVDVSFERGMGFEDVGTMRVSRADGPLRLGDIVSSRPLATVPVNLKVCGIEVVNDTIEMLDGDSVTNFFTFTQAVVLHLERGSFVVERSVWFEVLLSACVTDNPKLVMRDIERDWANGCAGSKYTAVVRREIIEI